MIVQIQVGRATLMDLRGSGKLFRPGLVRQLYCTFIASVLYASPWDEVYTPSLHQPIFKGDEMEGYVVRLADAFADGDFRTSVAKDVRP